LYPTPEQKDVLVSHCSHARFVWNLALEQANFYRTWQGPTPGSAARSRQLTEARAQFAWLGEGSSVVQQGALRDFDQAMKNWFTGLTNRRAGLPGKVNGRPTWRRAGTHEGFMVRDLEVHQLGGKWATVLIPKVGQVRFRLTRGWADVAKATSARVTKDASGHWHVSLTCLPPAFARVTTGGSTGVDRGVANSIATSQGVMDHAPTLSKSEQVRFLALARRMSRQRKSSNRRNRTRTSLAKLHATLANRRTDWSQKTASQLVQDFDLIAFEDLRTANMVRKPKRKPDPDQPGVFLPNGARAKAGLNKAILGSCWGQVAAMVTYKAAATPESSRTVLVRVNPHNTSRRCHACGHIAPGNRQSQAVFECVGCGHQAHADTNAARNILRLGLQQVLPGEVCGRSDRERTREPRAKTRAASTPKAA
jgi:transposase